MSLAATTRHARLRPYPGGVGPEPGGVGPEPGSVGPEPGRIGLHKVAAGGRLTSVKGTIGGPEFPELCPND